MRFASLGAGNCDLEIELARKLRARGHESFTIDCLDLNTSMLSRGRLAAEPAGVSGHLEFVEADCNHWEPALTYDAVLANQSLHHILNLEGLFEQVKKSLASGGRFIISDMIGRNGHQRWPEALEAVHEFWRGLPPSYRFNLRSGRYEELFQDWDCSTEGFEGVRSQDILPLLLRNFHFRLFVPFGNIIDPFIDRSFGHHFKPETEWDRAFIDRVQARDEAGLAEGMLTPTHMLAVVGNDSCETAFPGNLSPDFCLRVRDEASQSPAHSSPAYDWFSWPHDARRELQVICSRLARHETREGDLGAWGSRLDQELTTRTIWALKLERELEERTEWALRLEAELAAANVRNRDLQAELEERTAWALRTGEELQRELGSRTTWARRLESELEERTAWALRLVDEIEANKSAVASAHQLDAHPVRSSIKALRELIRSRTERKTPSVLNHSGCRMQISRRFLYFSA